MPNSPKRRAPQGKPGRDYVEAASERFRQELASLVTGYRRRGLEPSDLLGDPAEFAAKAVEAAVRIRRADSRDAAD